MNEQYDSERIYCRKLGHHLGFIYCRTEHDGLPCSRVLDCWFSRIPVRDFILANYSESERERIFAPPRQKTETLLDLIKKAQRHIKKE
ncbi:MAG: hypothetical protein JW881_01865 [Spirochaetales bacterium]|nr:hypothetical protein [Spirochaetales bacterium]